MPEARPTPSGLPPLLLIDGLHIHSKCATCLPARCCNYFAVQVDGPRSKSDFEDYLWFVAHEGVSLYVDGGRWYLQVQTRCRKLGANNLCTIYDSRPGICADYTPENCDRDDPPQYEREFRSYEELLAYARKRFPNFTTGGERAAQRRRLILERKARAPRRGASSRAAGRAVPAPPSPASPGRPRAAVPGGA